MFERVNGERGEFVFNSKCEQFTDVTSRNSSRKLSCGLVHARLSGLVLAHEKVSVKVLTPEDYSLFIAYSSGEIFRMRYTVLSQNCAQEK